MTIEEVLISIAFLALGSLWLYVKGLEDEE